MKLINKYKFFEAVTFLIATLFTSCTPFFFDSEGDCEVHHYVKFVYDLNLKWADAFPSEVKSVNLYIFDNNGVFVDEYTRNGDDLSKPDFSIEMDLPQGEYRMLAWCGLNNEGVTTPSFTVNNPVKGVTNIDEIFCSLVTSSVGNYDENDKKGNYSSERLNFLYWGYLEADIVDNQDGASYYYTISLTKDTNHIKVILQEINGDILDPYQFEFYIEADNGCMSWENALVGDEIITYEPWLQINDEVGIGNLDTSEGNVTFFKGVVADISVARLMANDKSSFFLTIINRENNEVIARIPFIQYALLSKDYYELAYDHKMTDQEFLDREDEYVMTLFLKNGKWLNTYIYIQQWRIVLHDYDFSE